MTNPDHVLLLDDDHASNFLLQMVLREVGLSSQMHVYANPLEALRFLKEQVQASGTGQLPEWMFVDINMPVLNGFEFLEEATQIQGLDLDLIRTVIITSSTYPKDAERARRFNLAGYLVKPVTPEKIQELLASEKKELPGGRSGMV